MNTRKNITRVLDYLPLFYWLKRYSNNKYALIQRIVFTDIFSLCLLSLVYPNFGQGDLLAYLNARFSLLLVYEVGYHFNDVKDIENESDKRLDYIFIIIRILIVTGLSFFSSLKCLIAFLVLIPFITHSRIKSKNRWSSYLLLQMFVFLYPAWFVGLASDISLDVAFLMFPMILALTANYYYGKFIKTSNFAKIRLRILLLLSFFFYFFSILGFFIGYEISFFSLGAAIISTFVCFSIAIIGFKSSILNTFRTLGSGFHNHTFYSHDSNINLRYYLQQIEVGEKHSVVITDHAEDMSARKFQKMKKLTKMLSRNIKMGVEYPFSGEHILVVEPDNYSDYKDFDPRDWRAKQKCELIIWAHPRVSVKKFIKVSSYRRNIIKILHSCDGIEVLNVKSCGRAGQFLRGVMFSFMFYMSGKGLIFIGEDTHQKGDPKILKFTDTRSIVLNRVTKRIDILVAKLIFPRS